MTFNRYLVGAMVIAAAVTWAVNWYILGPSWGIPFAVVFGLGCGYLAAKWQDR